jgi:crossover junction endodeoxyribonuclease RuvC
MGVDPGLTRCGLGVVEASPGRRVSLVAVGVERTPADWTLDRRLLRLDERIAWWIGEYRPDSLSVERVFAQHNLLTVVGTAQVAGLALLEAAKAGIEVAAHTPSEAKAAVTGSGQADKAQVQHMVARLLGLAEVPGPPDAADALAQAICHAWRPTTMDPAHDGTATPAQKAWLEAERAARRRPARRATC